MSGSTLAAKAASARGRTAATAVVATVPATMARRETSLAMCERAGASSVVFATMIHRYSPVSLGALQKAVNSPRSISPYCAFSSMNVKSDWFRFGLPCCGFDAPF